MADPATAIANASQTASVIAYVGALTGLVVGSVAVFNSWKAVCWKRAELANTYLKDFNNNPELVFAGRCLDWNGGRLVLPESLRPYMPDNASFIQHDRRIFAKALRPDLMIDEMDEDPRIQIYRTAIDSFLSWLSLVASALDRKLYKVADMEDIGYWVAKIQSERVLHGFIIAFGYQANIDKLIWLYRSKQNPYRFWLFPANVPPKQSATAAPQSTPQPTQELDTQVRPPDRRVPLPQIRRLGIEALRSRLGEISQQRP